MALLSRHNLSRVEEVPFCVNCCPGQKSAGSLCSKQLAFGWRRCLFACPDPGNRDYLRGIAAARPRIRHKTGLDAGKADSCAGPRNMPAKGMTAPASNLVTNPESQSVPLLSAPRRERAKELGIRHERRQKSVRKRNRLVRAQPSPWLGTGRWIVTNSQMRGPPYG